MIFVSPVNETIISRRYPRRSYRPRRNWESASLRTILRFATSDIYIGFSNQGPTKLIDNTFTWDDTLTWIKGAHTFKGGATFTPYQNNTIYDFYINGQFYFRDVGGSSGPYTRNDRADFMLALADEFLQYPAAPSNIRS